MAKPATPAESRFWKHVTKGDGCWEWVGSRLPKGYGRFWAGDYIRPGRKRITLAHRWAYATAIGPIPDGALVCHRCDNPSCVRPDHLFVGSYVDNSADAVSKGRVASGPASGASRHPERMPHGETHPFAKLSEADVRAIRASEEHLAVVARSFGISRSHVCDIRARRRWKQLQ